MDILDKIIETKKVEVARQKEAVPLSSLLTIGEERLNRQTLSMRQALATSSSGIIAEFKRRSPSKGWLHPEAKIEDIVPFYAQGGASACSILTDSDYFGGSLDDLLKARSLVNIPLLRKDFVIDEYQLYQAKAMGADAVLLIAACLTKEACSTLAETAHSLQLEVLLEIHSTEELDYINPYVDMLGVNNRNLGSFHTDIENSFRLIEEMQRYTEANNFSPLLIAESGISQTESVKALRKAGFGGFLIGETFMKTDNPGETLAAFINALA